MPVVKKGKTTKKKLESIDEDETISHIDVQYNPDIVANLLKDLSIMTDAKCSQLEKDAEFMITSMKQAFHLEMIKLPNQVKQMSMKRFKEEYGQSLEAVTRGNIATLANKSTANDKNAQNQKVFQTPSIRRNNNAAAPSTIMRAPREGEVILSANGSPLGEFNTVVKAPKQDRSCIIPATPGVFIPLKTGEVVDMEAVDVSELTPDMKHEALNQMQTMMDNMKKMMDKLKSNNV
jgi:hypothetical protein